MVWEGEEVEAILSEGEVVILLVELGEEVVINSEPEWKLTKIKILRAKKLPVAYVAQIHMTFVSVQTELKLEM